MTNVDNPAVRMLNLLRYMDNYDPKSPLRSAVSDYFGFDNEQPQTAYDPRMFRAIASLMELPGQIRAAVEKRGVRVPPDELLLRPLQNIEKAFRHLGGLPTFTAKQFSDCYSEADLHGLEFCIYGIEGVGGQRETQADAVHEIESLADEILALLEKHNDSIDSAAARFMWTHATKIRRATECVRAAGSDLLSESLDQALGGLMRDPQSRKWLHQEKSGVGQQFRNLLAKLAIAVQLTDAALGLPAGVSDLLVLENDASLLAPGPALNGPVV